MSTKRKSKKKGRSMTAPGGNDRTYTPPDLARIIVYHFRPSGTILEPCRGKGAFSDIMPGCKSCEIDEGRNFFEEVEPVDWIVTNPPWSILREFLIHSMELADNIVFLCCVEAIMHRARQRDIDDCDFGIVEILKLKTPPEPWPQSGFQLGAVWLRRGWKGSTHIHS